VPGNAKAKGFERDSISHQRNKTPEKLEKKADRTKKGKGTRRKKDRLGEKSEKDVS